MRQKTNKLVVWGGMSVIICVGGLIYASCLASGYFPWDDLSLIVKNPFVHHLSFANLYALVSDTFLGNYVPVTMLLHGLEWWLGNGAAWPFHLVSILLHLACAKVVYRLAIAIVQNRKVALFTALLFVASPVQVESVAWIAEQKTVLSGLFYLLAMLNYTRYLKYGLKWDHFKVLGFFILALLSKGTAATLPLSLLGLVFLIPESGGISRRWRGLALFACIALIFGVLAIWTQSHDGYLRPGRLGTPWGERLVLAAYALAEYVIRLIVPVHLSALYPIPKGLQWFHYVVGLAGLLCVLMLLWNSGPCRNKRIGLLLLYAGPLLPLLQLIPFGEALMADRYCYVAAFPIFLMVGYLLFRIFSFIQSKLVIGYGIVFLVLSFYVYVAKKRITLWGDDIAMFRNIVEQFPDSDIAQFDLANTYRLAGHLTESKHHFILATRLNDDYPQAWLGLGLVNVALHQCGTAIGDFTKVMGLAPNHPNTYLAYYHRARCYMDLGQPDLARVDLLEALARDPSFAPAHYQLAVEMAGSGNHRTAISQYSLALMFGYDPVACLVNRAISFGWLGENEAAIYDLDNVLKRNPGNATGWFLRGVAKVRNGENGCLDLKRADLLGYLQAKSAIAKLCPTDSIMH